MRWVMMALTVALAGFVIYQIIEAIKTRTIVLNDRVIRLQTCPIWFAVALAVHFALLGICIVGIVDLVNRISSPK